MNSDLDMSPVWETLCSSNVLLLIDTHYEPDTVDDGLYYDEGLFDSRLGEVVSWFSSIISDKLSAVDFRMSNNAVLSVRPLTPMPSLPKDNSLKVMVLR